MGGGEAVGWENVERRKVGKGERVINIDNKVCLYPDSGMINILKANYVLIIIFSVS